MSNQNALPIVCTLSPQTLVTRKAGLLPGLAKQATAREDAGESITLRFRRDALADIASVVDAERKCCRFLRFEIVAEPDEGPVALTLSGPAGTAAFVGALLEV